MEWLDETYNDMFRAKDVPSLRLLTNAEYMFLSIMRVKTIYLNMCEKKGIEVQRFDESNNFSMNLGYYKHFFNSGP